MPELTSLVAFIGATLILVLLPGPNLLYIVGAGIGGGRRTAMAAAAGVEVGTLIHVLAAALGISAFLQSSAAAFSTVKYLGVAYLVYLGIKALRATPAERGARVPEPPTSLAAMRQGAIVNLLNPKVSLFFLAFFPQFIDPDRGPVARQILVLGAVFFVIGLAIDLVYAFASGSIGRWLRARPASFRRQDRIVGSIYLCLAALAAIQGSRTATTT